MVIARRIGERQGIAVAVRFFRPRILVVVRERVRYGARCVEDAHEFPAAGQPEGHIPHYIGYAGMYGGKAGYFLGGDKIFSTFKDRAVRKRKCGVVFFIGVGPSGQIDIGCTGIVQFHPVLAFVIVVRVVVDFVDDNGIGGRYCVDRFRDMRQHSCLHSEP